VKVNCRAASRGVHELTPSDLAAFQRLGIGMELLAKAHVQRVTNAEAREMYGITGSITKDMSGIVFPYFSIATGKRVTARVRRDNPEIEDGKEKDKYISAYGDRKHLYFTPDAKDKLRTAETAIVLVEAEKSCLALTAWAHRTGVSLLPVAVGGCWGWRGRIGKVENAHGARVDEMGPISDLSCCCDERKVYVLLDANVASNPKVRQAQSALVAELRKRNCETLLCDLPEVQGVNGPDDYIAVCGDDAMAQILANAHDGADQPAGFSDDAMALRFTAEHGSDLRFTAAWGRWSRWDGTRWKRDETLHVFDLARRVCRTASSCQEPRLASRVASAVTVAAVERLARADRRHAATVGQWDADSWTLNTPGGIVDLRTGVLRPGKREDYCTKITAVAPAESCSLWHQFLARITYGNGQLQHFLQRVCGYALTGITREHALFFLYGTGANGKSVFINTIAGVMGEYAKAAPIETFIASSSEHHPTDLAGLQGARLVTAVETEDGRRWAESKLKVLTGGERIPARFMRQDFFEYVPQFKLLIAGNHKPGLRTVDEAMRRRLNLLPFTVTIPAQERDLELREKLRAERGGILQWMIEGCLSWQREGLNAPAVVRAATTDYLAAEDTLGRWLEECCVSDNRCSSSASALFGSWKRWCEQNGEQSGSQKGFSESLQSRGFSRVRKAQGKRAFSGLGLRSDTSG
jgi:putative DNA primase/helicase